MVAKLGTFLKKLFGGGGGDLGAARDSGREVEYGGYTIRPSLMPRDGQFQTAGVIRKTLPDGTAKEHRFIRADTHASREDAEAFSVTKAQQIIDEQGDRLFRDG